MARTSLPTTLLLIATLACSRASTTTDCPPASNDGKTSSEVADPASTETEPEPAPTIDGDAEALTVNADDGHALRLWSLAPAGERDDRPAIVLVHGRTWSGLPDFDLRVGDDDSLSLMRSLAGLGFATYAVDLRGYGGTERDASGWLTPDRAAADLDATLSFVRERHGQAPAVLGWSFGALVAQLCVQRSPEAASALILYGYPRDPDERTPESAAKGEPPRKQNSEAAARSDFITEGTIREQAIAAYAKASLAADPVRVDWAAGQQFNALDPAQVKIPTLVIHGVGDPIARQLWQAKLFTRLQVPDRQWVILANADHAAHLEQPADFLRALLSFLDRGPA
ncbi:MAG TPA: alpha/beta fold hydrolase [Enhygromyxa sp.]|nr:alpha/beta fold hydrolase [Enhygromyxa sp.]